MVKNDFKKRKSTGVPDQIFSYINVKVCRWIQKEMTVKSQNFCPAWEGSFCLL
jgi:hypothetical protein